METQIELSVENKCINDDVLTSSRELSVLPKETENRIPLMHTRRQHQQLCSAVHFRDETAMKVMYGIQNLVKSRNQ